MDAGFQAMRKGSLLAANPAGGMKILSWIDWARAALKGARRRAAAQRRARAVNVR